MDIQNIDKKQRQVTVTLNSDELIKICNCLYHADEKNQKGVFHQLYSDMIIARDLSQYGHIDNWSLSRIIKQRTYCGLDLAKENKYDKK